MWPRFHLCDRPRRAGFGDSGRLTAARKGREPDQAPIISVGGPEGRSAEAAAVSLGTIATHLCRIAAILEIEADERWDGKDFRDKVEDRMMRLIIDDVKRAAKE